MPKLVYDTRFFFEYFYTTNGELHLRAKDFVSKNKDRYVSVVTLHELYLLDLQKRGREIAKLSLQTIQDLFRVAQVDSKIAITAAELRNRYKLPMGDSLIAATCEALDARCITDDPHLIRIKEIKTRWF